MSENISLARKQTGKSLLWEWMPTRTQDSSKKTRQMSNTEHSAQDISIPCSACNKTHNKVTQAHIHINTGPTHPVLTPQIAIPALSHTIPKYLKFREFKGSTDAPDSRYKTKDQAQSSCCPLTSCSAGTGRHKPLIHYHTKAESVRHSPLSRHLKKTSYKLFFYLTCL